MPRIRVRWCWTPSRSGRRTTSLLYNDHQDTQQIAINAGTQTVDIRRQTPYGTPRGSNPTWVNDKGFVGGDIDPTNLVNIGARQYDQVLGRFISVDPVMDLADPQQWNPYTYANNSPVTLSDPSGLIWVNDGGGKYVPPPSQPAPSVKKTASKPKSCKWYDVGCGVKKAGNWASKHKAEITGFVVGTVVGVGCGAAIGWTGVGAVACGAAAGAAGSFVTGYMKGQRGWDLAKTTAVGGLTGAIGGAVFSVGGAALGGAFRAAAGNRLAGAASAARGELSSIARGRITGGFLGRGGGAKDTANMDSFVPSLLPSGATVRYSTTATVTNFGRSLGAGGRHDVIVHGTSEGRPVVNGNVTHTQQIADATLENPAYDGCAITLVMCHGGREAAAELSQILGVDVYATTRQAQLHPVTGELLQGEF